MSSFRTVDGIGDNKGAEIEIEKLKVTPTRPTSVSPSAFSRRAVVSYWRKYVHEVLVNRL